MGRARAFFDELVEGGYRYVYPPAERGAAAMLRDRRGGGPWRLYRDIDAAKAPRAFAALDSVASLPCRS